MSRAAERGYNPEQEQAKKPESKLDLNEAAAQDAKRDDTPSLEQLVTQKKAQLAQEARVQRAKELEEINKLKKHIKETGLDAEYFQEILHGSKDEVEKKRKADLKKLTDTEVKRIKKENDQGLE